MSKDLHSRIRFVLLLLTAFLLPMGRFVALLLGLLLFHWIIEGGFKEKFLRLRRSKLFFFLTLYYLLHLVGMLYTINMASGWFDLEVKLPLLLFPLVIVSVELNDLQFKRVLMAFVLGSVLVSFICLLQASVDYLNTSVNHFFYESFSLWLHPSYLAMHLIMALAVLVFFIASKKWSSSQDYLTIGLMAFLSFIVFLLSSKMGILTMTLFYGAVISFYIIKKKKVLIGIVGLVFILTSIFITLKYIPQVGERVRVACKALFNTNPDPTNPESSAVRLSIWGADKELIGRNLLLGTGTGDVKDELLAMYKEKGITGAYAIDEQTGKVTKLLNTHNQFLQSFTALGIFGFLLLLGSVLFILIEGIKKRNYLLLVFALLVLLNFMVESMLEREVGVMFFGFFASLLFQNLNSES